jgi:catechol 2,3-dioxygenase-like lactoylglutathione lyase family enzyme
MNNIRFLSSGLLVMVFCMMLIVSCQNGERQSAADLEIRANLVFFYYHDLARAQQFYEEILGLERVLDYGFATIHKVSPSFYLGLVDEKEGMHKISEPKTATLAFVTDEVDGWYDYLKEQGVELRGPVGDATRHPTRGFVAYDPEGYFLEFETFLDHPQNMKLMSQLEGVKSIFPKHGLNTYRPQHLGVRANVLWLYYNDLAEAQQFYENVIGQKLLVDQGFAKVYTSSKAGFIGLVDQAQGLHRFSEEKSVNVSFITPQVDEWYKALKRKGLEMRSPLDDAEEGLVRAFVTYDVAGYFLEFDWFYEQEENRILLKHLTE